MSPNRLTASGVTPAPVPRVETARTSSPPEHVDAPRTKTNKRVQEHRTKPGPIPIEKEKNCTAVNSINPCLRFVKEKTYFIGEIHTAAAGNNDQLLSQFLPKRNTA